MSEPLPDAEKRAPVEEPSLVFGSPMSWWARLLNLIALLVILTVTVIFVWLMSSLPRIEGRVPVKGLELPATIARDEAGIPHIVARSLRDAYFAIGWTHAQDRLWQMEMQRRIAAGRLSEVVGEAGLRSDRFMRTLGLRPLAENDVDQLDQSTKEALQAYADGINAWLRDNWYRLPPEFATLRLRPEPWHPADSLLIGRLLSLQLSNDWRSEILKAKLANRLPQRRIEELWPAALPEGPVSLSMDQARAMLAAIPDAATPHLASNVWVVSGTRTASGKPLLANDPHLGLQAPIQWYLVSVEAPGLSLVGGTLPGIPFHLIGHNGRIAWGTTTTHADTVDLVLEKLAGPGGYQWGRGSEPFATRTEVIKVRGEPDVDITVRRSRHGPIISDVMNGGVTAADQVMAFHATALEPCDLAAQAMLKINRAIDWPSFQAALRDFQSPVQNFAFADTSGTIAFATAGQVPLRKGNTGGRPLKGWTGEADWTGWIAPEKMPQQINPKSGRVVNANNRVVGPSYPYVLASEWPDGYRAQRITDLLGNRTDLTMADMADIQRDTLSLPALEIKELLDISEVRDPLATEAAQRIARWDGNMAADRPEPLIFSAWIGQLWHDLLADELGEDFSFYDRVRPAVLINILTGQRHWCDDVATPEAESCESMTARALERAIDQLKSRHGGDLSTWRWGDEHQAVFSHPILGQAPLVGHYAEPAIATGGDDFTINRGSFMAGSFRQIHGPGLRAIFDLADLANSRFIIATGESGNPLSHHYDDLLTAWRDNRGIPIGRRPEDAALLRLEPGY